MPKRNELPPEERYIGSAEVAARLNCHLISVYRFIRLKPDFPQPRRLANKLAWKEADIRVWIEAQPLRERNAR